MVINTGFELMGHGSGTLVESREEALQGLQVRIWK